MADRVAVMSEGRLLQIGTPREIYDRPATRAVAAFVGQSNLWDGRVRTATEVDTPIGTLHTLPHGFAAGTTVGVLVRPERIALGIGADNRNSFRGRIVRDRFLGSVRRFDLDVEGHTVTVESTAIAPADTVHLPPEAVQVVASELKPSSTGA